MNEPEQMSLFRPRLTGPAKYVRGSATSEAAAKSVRPRTETLRLRALAYVKSTGRLGATCDEMQAAGVEGLVDHQTASPRFTELRDRDLICPTGRTRATRKGRQAVVYCCTVLGEAVLRN